MVSNDGLLKSSISSASSLVALQLLSRLFTFSLNQALIRLVSPGTYGTAAIQFELMLSTILFLSREGVRNSLLRASKDKMTGNASVSNLSFLPIVLGIPLAVSMTWLYGIYAGEEVRSQPHFGLSIWVYSLAALVELLAEPMHNTAMSELRTDIRVKAEGLGVTVKTLVTFGVLYYDSRKESSGDLALFAFALGQLSYGICVLLKYIDSYGMHLLHPRYPLVTKDKTTPFLDPGLFRLSMNMTLQSIVKHFLTEGDKFILSWFSPLQDQGGYAIAVNYGSLIARIAFQPIEETLRIFFSRTLSSPASQRPTEEELDTASHTLISLISAQVSFSLFLLAFAPSYLLIALRILLPPRYLETSAPAVLQAWIYYIPFLAINGGLEAFVSSVAKPSDLARQSRQVIPTPLKPLSYTGSRFMALFSGLYIATAVVFYKFTPLGDASLVYANIVNLMARIAYCIHFSNSYYTLHRSRYLLSWSKAIPRAPFLLSIILSVVLVRRDGRMIFLSASDRGLRLLSRIDIIMHVSYGIILALTCIGVWWKVQPLSLPTELPSKKS
ncbi:hypothetical protein AX15_004757 [Amanita polypyramis BW_CC]|nr:hypothetical protein AX15_004757 [Amanita polypyramis BW_CC]